MVNWSTTNAAANWVAHRLAEIWWFLEGHSVLVSHIQLEDQDKHSQKNELEQKIADAIAYREQERNRLST